MKSFLSVRVSLCLICAVTSCVMPSRAVNITETSTPLVKHSAATPLEVSAERLRVDIPLGSTIETGSFNSTDDPTPSPFSQVFHGGFDAFVAKLNTTDSTRVYATYVRGDDRDFGDTLSVDASGKASVVGVTNSPDFPTANQLQPIKAGGSLGDDAFLAQMSDGEFNPTSDTELDGGIHTFSSVYIPAGVTVTVIGDVVINVTGDTAIAGNLIGDCVQIELLGQGDLTITGTVDNRCTGDPTDAGDLILQSEGRNMTIGTEEAAASLHSSGDLDVTNDISIQDWEFDVLPDQRSDSLLPPVCSATSDTVLDTPVPGFPIEVQFFGDGADPDGGPVGLRA